MQYSLHALIVCKEFCLLSSQCVDPYIREAGGRCYLDTDGDNIADYVDKCPYEFGVDCMASTPLPPQSKCPSEVDTPWRLHWRDTKRGSTLYTRCPGGIEVSVGMYYILYAAYTNIQPTLCTYIF